LPRAVCDALFYEMLLALGADKRRAGLMYAGLRVGGGSRYAACKGGVKDEDMAWALMREEERNLASRQRLSEAE
ncbi:TPA: hypothetical protein QEM72_004281, partial [Pseudomonas putida]|nr:hypothetical protein [Pseudomonas putida]